MAAFNKSTGQFWILLQRAATPSTLTVIENSRNTSSTRQAPRRLPYSKADSTNGAWARGSWTISSGGMFDGDLGRMAENGKVQQ